MPDAGMRRHKYRLNLRAASLNGGMQLQIWPGLMT
jgi:hypothetical protein